jgi:hypothetical protein
LECFSEKSFPGRENFGRKIIGEKNALKDFNFFARDFLVF